MRLLSATICLILIVSEYGILRGEEMKPIAVGDWSEWNDGLRGRLLLSEGRICSPDGKTRETLVYVELENRIDSGRIFDVYFDANNLKCELRDADREAVPDRQIPISRIRQGKPAKCWVTLPDGSRLRLRVNPCCNGRPKDVGLLIPLGDTAWLISAGDTDDYFLSGALTIRPPKDHGRVDAWQGTLKLPKTKITLGKP